jgi:hypothetical protein
MLILELGDLSPLLVSSGLMPQSDIQANSLPQVATDQSADWSAHSKQ